MNHMNQIIGRPGTQNGNSNFTLGDKGVEDMRRLSSNRERTRRDRESVVRSRPVRKGLAGRLCVGDKQKKPLSRTLNEVRSPADCGQSDGSLTPEGG
jgi:hypothetical protein